MPNWQTYGKPCIFLNETSSDWPLQCVRFCCATANRSINKRHNINSAARSSNLSFSHEILNGKMCRKEREPDNRSLSLWNNWNGCIDTMANAISALVPVALLFGYVTDNEHIIQFKTIAFFSSLQLASKGWRTMRFNSEHKRSIKSKNSKR